jgi:hypothetical protein
MANGEGEKIMLRVAFIFCTLFLSYPAFSKCTLEQSVQFQETWKKYYAAALTKDPKLVAQYIKFPFKLLSFYDGVKPTIITKQFFLKNYFLIFEKNKVSKNTEFSDDFSKFEKMSESQIREKTNEQSCSAGNGNIPNITLENYVFFWNATSGWAIHGVYYSDYDRDNLFYSVKHPELDFDD